MQLISVAFSISSSTQTGNKSSKQRLEKHPFEEKAKTVSANLKRAYYDCHFHKIWGLKVPQDVLITDTFSTTVKKKLFSSSPSHSNASLLGKTWQRRCFYGINNFVLVLGQEKTKIHMTGLIDYLTVSDYGVIYNNHSCSSVHYHIRCQLSPLIRTNRTSSYTRWLLWCRFWCNLKSFLRGRRGVWLNTHLLRF